MERIPYYLRKKLFVVYCLFQLGFLILIGRIVYLCIFQSFYYTQNAYEIEQRERKIKGARGEIVDANGVVLATNRTVCTVSLIHNQVKEPDKVIDMLQKELDLSYEEAKKRVEKVSSIEKITSNVSKEIGDNIRNYHLAGVKVDEDYKRYYPYDELASKVIGFTGSDNQGIIGLESKYESYLQGKPGKILTLTDARGIEKKGAREQRQEATPGWDLHITLDYEMQRFGQQLAEQTMEKTGAKQVELLVLDPKDGAIKAMINVPEFSLNQPFDILNISEESLGLKEKQEIRNEMWRNSCVSDTYEPGSTFKIITTAIALEKGVVQLEDRFHCPGYITVEDTRIRCHKTTGHGSQNFVEGIMNSCNPVFIQLGQRIGPKDYFSSMKSMGLLDKTNVDLPGEANTIMHQLKNVGPVEMATVSFGQSFQITPIQLATTVASYINGGYRVTPHLAKEVISSKGQRKQLFQPAVKRQIVSGDTSQKLQYLLHQVVAEGTGKKGGVEGFEIGGKTATSQMLPRGSGKYIASFIGFVPASKPDLLALVIIHEPQGIYYGGTIAAPVVSEFFANVLQK